MAKKQGRTKYKPDEIATLMTDLKRTGIWTVLAIAAVIVIALIIERVI